MIQKISKLLALAQGASTPAEAEACFAKAQALATANSISLAEARLIAKPEVVEQPIHRTLTIGLPRKRANKHLVNLMHAIAVSNDVEMNIAHNSTYVVMFGFPTDIDVCEELWIQIAQRMVQFADAFLRDVQTNKQVARSSYYEGFITTLRPRLATARTEAVMCAATTYESRSQAADPIGNTTLALRNKSATVTDYYKTNSSARGSWGGDRRRTKHSTQAAAAGGLAARQVVLPGGPEIAGGRLSIGAGNAN